MVVDLKLDFFRFKLMFVVIDNFVFLFDDQIVLIVLLILDFIELMLVGFVIFCVVVEDNVGIWDVIFYDGDKFLGIVIEVFYEWKFVYIVVDNGEYVICVVVMDISGNIV